MVVFNLEAIKLRNNIVFDLSWAFKGFSHSISIFPVGVVLRFDIIDPNRPALIIKVTLSELSCNLRIA